MATTHETPWRIGTGPEGGKTLSLCVFIDALAPGLCLMPRDWRNTGDV